MDYKDKLRLAKEALDSGSYDKETIEYIFPELAESENERIRKEIIDFVKSRGGFKGDWIAWLEKQGSEPNWCHHKVDLSNCSEEYCKAYYDGWNNCNQQYAQLKAEKKPAWSEEDEKIIIQIKKALEDFFSASETDKIKYWLNFLKDRVHPQSHWKPSDEQMNALWSATEKYLESNNENVRKLRGEVLESLYEDLKKLKG